MMEETAGTSSPEQLASGDAGASAELSMSQNSSGEFDAEDSAKLAGLKIHQLQRMRKDLQAQLRQAYMVGPEGGAATGTEELNAKLGRLDEYIAERTTALMKDLCTLSMDEENQKPEIVSGARDAMLKQRMAAAQHSSFKSAAAMQSGGAARPQVKRQAEADAEA